VLKSYARSARMSPFTVAMAIFMLSLAGIPPLAGFVGKFYVFSAAVKQGFIWLTIIGVLNSLVSVYYYLRVTVFMYMKEPVKEVGQLSFSIPILIALFITTFFTLHMGILPSSYLHLARESIAMLVW